MKELFSTIRDRSRATENSHGNEVSEGHRLPERAEGEDVVRQVHRVLAKQGRKGGWKAAQRPLCPKAGTPKWKAEQMLHAIILKECRSPAKTSPSLPRRNSDVSLVCRRTLHSDAARGKWSPAYRKINTYEIKHYLVGTLGDSVEPSWARLRIQVWLNNLATKYSESVVRHCYINIRSITAHGQEAEIPDNEDPGEDVTMPQTKPVEKPLMTQEQILRSLAAFRTCTICV
jgi:hypothetical protein